MSNIIKGIGGVMNNTKITTAEIIRRGELVDDWACDYGVEEIYEVDGVQYSVIRDRETDDPIEGMTTTLTEGE